MSGLVSMIVTVLAIAVAAGLNGRGTRGDVPKCIYWRQRVAHVSSPWFLGEDENGNLWSYRWDPNGLWDVPFRWYNPTLWPQWLASRLALKLTYLESE